MAALLLEHEGTGNETQGAAGPITGSGEPSSAPSYEENLAARCAAKITPDSSRRVIVTLVLSFAILILTMVVVGWWTSWRIMVSDAHLEQNLHGRTAKLRMVYDVLHYSTENSRIVVEILLQKTLFQELLAHRVENSNKITALLSALEALCDSQQEQKLVAAANSTRAAYVRSYRRAIDLVDGKDNHLARSVVINEAAPALFVYHRALEDLAGFELQQMGVATERATQHDTTTRRIGLIMQLIATLLAAGIAVFTTCRIAKDVRIRNRMQTRLGKLNARLEHRVAARTRDLGRAEQQLRDSLARMRNYVTEIEAVNELTKLLQSCLTLEEARQQTSRVMHKFFPAGAVLLLNSSRNLLEVALSWGEAPGAQGPYPPESCWALRKGEMHVAGPHCTNPICSHCDGQPGGCHICIPMIAHGGPLGTLSINDDNFCGGHRNSPTFARKLKLATTLAEQISLAFANLTLRETLKYQSVRDPLTGLFNRRHMEEIMERELRRAARNNTSVSVLMMDIDHFKQFNDIYGHEAGDLVLREFGLMLRLQVRGADVACRYGGEEFLLIMGETDAQTACERAEILRQRVALLPLRYRGQTLRRLTISIGVASFPAQGSSAAQLVSSADTALYRAKREGRDRVLVAA